ncbi:NAD(P)-dependent oxidoreductase [Sinomicrobium kalidii]|uniref:NAD-dependent epimerase/dehydratase family protein n=1 Tax=Sinomicrobium kalidii TaxID=2900738 RepID=UPI001E4304FD|nr:NAD(P)-dependent oxidoreductase [Sinomicrobium kalidii]UGU14380.1 NAD(P)-dependent oxidoreductase [Sinomicrobium kalidii]
MGNTITSGDIIVITGGGGYLGSKLAEFYLHKNCQLFLIDINFNNLAKKLNENYDTVHLEHLDLTSENLVREVLNRISPDYIFHFASIIDRSRDFDIYDRLYEINVKGTINLLKALQKISYRGFYFASTSEVYGSWKGVPFSEDSSLTSASPYSLTKIYCEKAIQLFSDLYNKPYKIFRIFNFFGPNMPGSTFIGQMIEAFKAGKVFEMTQGDQARDILFIDDLLTQMNVVVTKKSDFSVFNICSGKAIKMIEIVEEFEKITGEEFQYTTLLPYRKNEVWETRGDNSRLKSLNYIFPSFSLKEALKKCI